MTLERYLQDLTDESKALKHAELIHLSGLTPEELGRVEAVWDAVESQRRLQLTSRLLELAEGDPTLDFTALFKMALNDPKEEVRERAVAGLWECEDRHLITVFSTLLQSDPAERVRAAAAQALGKFAALAADDKLLSKYGERIHQVLWEAFNDEREKLMVRRRAIEAISAFNDETVRELIQRAYQSPDMELQRSAVFAMGHNSDPQWISTILKEVRSNDAAMRYEAASACGELGEEVALPYVIPLLRDEDLEVRLAAIRAVGAVGGSMAKKALTAYLRSADEVLKEAVYEALEMADHNVEPLTFKFQA